MVSFTFWYFSSVNLNLDLSSSRRSCWSPEVSYGELVTRWTHHSELSTYKRWKAMLWSQPSWVFFAEPSPPYFRFSVANACSWAPECLLKHKKMGCSVSGDSLLCRLEESVLPPCERCCTVASKSTEYRHLPKVGGAAVPPIGGIWQHSVAWAETYRYLHAKRHIDSSDCLATIHCYRQTHRQIDNGDNGPIE